jgi:hypothetical protein
MALTFLANRQHYLVENIYLVCLNKVGSALNENCEELDFLNGHMGLPLPKCHYKVSTKLIVVLVVCISVDFQVTEWLSWQGGSPFASYQGGIPSGSSPEGIYTYRQRAP